MDPRSGRFCLSSTLCHAFICCLLDSLQGKKQVIPLKWRSWNMNSRFIYDLLEWIVVEVLFIDSDKGTNWRRRKCVHWHSALNGLGTVVRLRVWCQGVRRKPAGQLWTQTSWWSNSCEVRARRERGRRCRISQTTTASLLHLVHHHLPDLDKYRLLHR